MRHVAIYFSCLQNDLANREKKNATIWMSEEWGDSKESEWEKNGNLCHEIRGLETILQWTDARREEKKTRAQATKCNKEKIGTRQKIAHGINHRAYWITTGLNDSKCTQSTRGKKNYFQNCHVMCRCWITSLHKLKTLWIFWKSTQTSAHRDRLLSLCHATNEEKKTTNQIEIKATENNSYSKTSETKKKQNANRTRKPRIIL